MKNKKKGKRNTQSKTATKYLSIADGGMTKTEEAAGGVVIKSR